MLKSIQKGNINILLNVKEPHKRTKLDKLKELVEQLKTKEQEKWKK